MKTHIQELLIQALDHLKRDGVLPDDHEVSVQIERPRKPEHGDYASNLALTLTKIARRPPLELAEAIKKQLPESRHVTEVTVAAPGFLNFRLSRDCLRNVIREALERGEDFGAQPTRPEDTMTLEFVSANPTGPLHVGHGRGAAYGASLAAVLAAAGYSVQKEYYVNDNGRQMDILAVSVWLRYLELCGESLRFPDNGYRGDYVYDIARSLRQDQGDDLRHNQFEVYDGLPPDESDGGDKERHIDALIERARKLLGEDGYRVTFDRALAAMLDDIREDLGEFGVHFDHWFSERSLEESGAITHAINTLRETGHLYEKDGAQWFRASELGDEKDRVVVRENGRTTYFASDIAYLLNKLERGFNKAVYIFGADHHGYVPRLYAATRGLGQSPERLEFQLVQFAVLYRGGEKVQMSTRSGKFVTLRELREEVGNDAARFFYVMRSHEQHLDFDLDLAKSKSQDNPVFYIQYAHARICSLFRNLEKDGLRHNTAIGDAALNLLEEDQEMQLVRTLNRYAEVLESAAGLRSPHLVAHYLQELSAAFHTCYNAVPILVDDENLRNARLSLMAATRQVIANGLGLLGVTAPESM
ncbi:MAG: arginine--tRNA ligase [Wenzhouxiangellaceae bacterium]